MQYPRCCLLLLGIAAVVDTTAISGCMVTGQTNPQQADGFDAEVAYSSPLPIDIDADRDGLADAEELALAERFAPVVTLHRDDWTRPASVDWLMDRMNIQLVHGDGASVLKFGSYAEDVRQGAGDPAHWVTYYHAYPSGDGGVHIQYWFFYPYNDGPLFFDHEADWEHVTVSVDAERKPLGVWAARHSNNRPGKWRSWDKIRTLNGTHPEILSARGSHASYFDPQDASWTDRVGRCPSLAGPCDHVLWPTWRGGGLRNMGERHAPLDVASMRPVGLWGKSGLLPGTSAPKGPAHQRGWCASNAPACSATF